MRNNIMINMKKNRFAVCHVSSFPDLYKFRGYVAVTATGKEISVVCGMNDIPATATDVSENWIMFEIMGKVDFSEVGIIAEISGAFAKNGVPVFVVSTYDTDYFLVKNIYLEKAVDALVTTGYPVVQ